MKKILNCVFISIFIFTSVFYVINPVKVFAQVSPYQPFGGYVLAMVPCTCSGPTFWILMAPLFLGPVSTAGALIYQTGSGRLFANFVAPPVPTTWLLGNYMPGVGQCQIYAGTSCITLPSLGTMNWLGTSFPGGSPAQ